MADRRIEPDRVAVVVDEAVAEAVGVGGDADGEDGQAGQDGPERLPGGGGGFGISRLGAIHERGYS